MDLKYNKDLNNDVYLIKVVFIEDGIGVFLSIRVFDIVEDLVIEWFL